MSLLSHLGRVRQGIPCLFHKRVVDWRRRGPIVSFTFDDFPKSAYSVGGATLEKFGARGTYYIASGLANTGGELGELFSADDLRALLDKGHELGSHTFHHSSARSVSCSDFQADVESGSKAVELLTGQDSTNFAYPFGCVTLGVKKTIGEFVSSARGIVPGINGPDVDLNLLRANRIYGDIDAARQIKELILRNVERKGWLIFYTHDVRPEPSFYGCTPALFEFAVSEAVRNSTRIMTISEVLSQIGNGTQTWDTTTTSILN